MRTGTIPDFSTYRVPRIVRGLGHNLLIAAARRAGVRVRIFSRDPALFQFSRGRRRVLIARLELGLNAPITRAICDRKDSTRAVLRRARLPVPRGVLLRLVEDPRAEARAALLGFPLVLKPPDGRGGRLVYPDVRTRRELSELLARYRSLGIREVLAEERVAGRNYRMLVLDGSIIGLSERIAPSVTGDGRSTVRRLVARSNAVRRGNLQVLPILLDDDALRTLRRQRLTSSSVPRRGRRVLLHDVTNISKGGRCREVLSEAHRSWQAIARRVRRALPGGRLLGVDVIAEDMAKDCQSQRWWIIEVNANPDFELHHFPWEGKPSDPASAILHALFV